MSIIRIDEIQSEERLQMAGWKASFPWQSAMACYKHSHEQTALAATTTRRKIRGGFPQQRKYCSPVVTLKFIPCKRRRLGSTMELWCPTQHSPCGPSDGINWFIENCSFELEIPHLQFNSKELSKKQWGTVGQADSWWGRCGHSNSVPEASTMSDLG